MTSPARDSPNREHYDDLLPAYVNGTLSPTERRQVSAHILRCDSCRARLDAWTAVAAASKAAFPPTPGTGGDSHEVVQEVLKRVAHSAPESGHSPDSAQEASPVQRLLSSS